MKVLMSLGIVITLSLIGGIVEVKAAGCEAIGNVRFICDQLGLSLIHISEPTRPY